MNEEEHTRLQQKMDSILTKIKRYYSITQNPPRKLLSNPNNQSSFNEHMIADLTEKLANFNKYKTQHKAHIQKNKENYWQTAKNTLTASSPFFSDQSLNDSAYVLYKDLVRAKGFVRYYYTKKDINKTHVVSLIQIMVDFEAVLGELSDQIAQIGIPSIAFSFTRHIELLASNYEQLYQTEYNGKNSLGIWHFFKQLTRTSSRKEDIQFLSNTISTHERCNDSIRHHAAYVISTKIAASNPHRSLLFQLLSIGHSCSAEYVELSTESFSIINAFCTSNHLTMPKAILNHIEKEINSANSSEYFEISMLQGD